MPTHFVHRNYRVKTIIALLGLWEYRVDPGTYP
jgi:hypothetical protein